MPRDDFLPNELVIFLTAMVPIGELRASVPLGIVSLGLPWSTVLMLSIIGNLAPVPFLIWILKWSGKKIENAHNVVGRLFKWRTTKLDRQYSRAVERYGLWAVIFIVSIPLPFTGAWTGSLVVWAMNISIKKGLIAIAIGICIAGLIVTALTVAGQSLFSLWGS